MNLYRIKPLEWKDNVTYYSDGRTAVESGYYYIELITENQWFWCYKRGDESDYGKASSLEEAKAACEAHRRKLLEAELEPAYQPEELPSTKATRMFVNKYIEKYQRTPIRLKCCCCFHQWDAEAIEPCGECTNNNVVKVSRPTPVVYQPTTELPAEPGLYWWRSLAAASRQWREVRLWGKSGGLLETDNETVARYELLYGPGQWIRIPEPEVER